MTVDHWQAICIVMLTINAVLDEVRLYDMCRRVKQLEEIGDE